MFMHYFFLHNKHRKPSNVHANIVGKETIHSIFSVDIQKYISHSGNERYSPTLWSGTG